MAGTGSVEACGAIFAQASRGASSNYGVDNHGHVGLYVEESRRAWTSSNRENDNSAVTIEVANDEIGGNWHVSDKALEKTIDLCVDICQRNGIAKLNFTGDKSGNLTMHKWFAPTACPGPYLESKFPYIADEVNKRLGAVQETPAAPDNSAPEASDGQLYRVQVGAYSIRANAEAMAEKLKKAGFNAYITATGGNATASDKKSVEEMAREVIQGKWGVGADRRQRLTEAGYDYAAVQAVVDKLMGR
jgi:hypothetical protein